MKKLLTLGFAMLCLTACSNDDDNNKSNVDMDQLQKRWYPESQKFNNGESQPYEGHLACGKDYTEFQASNVLKEVDVVDCQTDPTVTNGTYMVQDETLTTTIGTNTIVYTIKKLDSDELQLETTFNGNTITDIYTSNPSN